MPIKTKDINKNINLLIGSKGYESLRFIVKNEFYKNINFCPNWRR